MSDFRALQHSCSRLSVKKPHGDSVDKKRADEVREMSKGCGNLLTCPTWCSISLHVIRMSKRVLCMYKCVCLRYLCLRLMHYSGCMLTSVFSLFTFSEAISTRPLGPNHKLPTYSTKAVTMCCHYNERLKSGWSSRL